MGRVPPDYPDWKAPSADGDYLLWPAANQLLNDARANHQQFAQSHSVRLQNVPLLEARQRMRQWINHDDRQPLIATGHQTELHHAGVWIKNALIKEIATRTNGRAMHLAVDTDAPKHLMLSWPGGQIAMTDDDRRNTAAWSGLLDAPTPAHLAEIQNQIGAAEKTWTFKPTIDSLFDSLRRLSLESPNLSVAISNAMHRLDWDLGLQHDLLIASTLLGSEPYLLFVHDLLARAGESAEQYNGALAGYRKRNGITSSMRPMPDLLLSEGAVEVPFWLDDLKNGKRYRPSVFREENGWILNLPDGESFFFDPSANGWEASQRLQKWLAQTQHRLTPRALTLMLFMRLVVVDYFIHGIGGGRYDQVTDRLIESYYKIEAPKFGVTTATLYFPDAVGQSRVCLPCVKQEGHRLKHRQLGNRKSELVAQIDALPRHSKERSVAYLQMQSELAAANHQNSTMQSWQRKLDETVLRFRDEASLFNRELFYALQPRERLLGLIEKYNKSFESGV